MLKSMNSTGKPNQSSRSLLLAKHNLWEVVLAKKVPEVDLTLEDDSNGSFGSQSPKNSTIDSKWAPYVGGPILSHEKHAIRFRKRQRTTMFCQDCNVPVCTLCFKNTHDTLRRHMNHGQRKQCVTCSVYFPTKCALKAHSKLHEPYKGLLACPDCGILLEGIGSFIRHSLDVCLHLFRRSEFLCLLCDHISYESIFLYEQHIQNHIVYRYLCQLCSTIVDNRDRMLEHFLSDHNINSDGLSGKFKMSFYCQFCEQSVSPHHWKTHRKNRRMRIFQCSCSAKYRRKIDFELHRKACPRSSTLPECWNHLMKITEEKKMPTTKTCDCTEFWQQDNVLLCKRCLKVPNKKQKNITTVKMTDSIDWLGAEQIEEEEPMIVEDEEEEEEEICCMDYSKIPSDHSYCLRYDLKFNIDKCTADHDRTYFTIGGNASTLTAENTNTQALQNAEPSSANETCLICNKKIPMTPSSIYFHFKMYHLNHVLSFNPEDNITPAVEEAKTVEPSSSKPDQTMPVVSYQLTTTPILKYCPKKPDETMAVVPYQVSVTSISKPIQKKPDETMATVPYQVSVTSVSKPVQKKPDETMATVPSRISVTPVFKPPQKKPMTVAKLSETTATVLGPARLISGASQFKEVVPYAKPSTSRVLEDTFSDNTKRKEMEPIAGPSTSRVVEAPMPEKRQHEEMEPAEVPPKRVAMSGKEKVVPCESDKVTNNQNCEQDLPRSSRDGIQFWEKANGALKQASKKTVSKEEKIKLLHEIQTRKRVAKKPARLLDEVENYPVFDLEDDEEVSPESKKKKKRSKVCKPRDNCLDLVPYKTTEGDQEVGGETVDTEEPDPHKSLIPFVGGPSTPYRWMGATRQCTKCAECFNTHDALEHHLGNVHKMSLDEIAEYISDNRYAIEIPDIKLHVTACSEMKQETETDENQCKICKERFDNATDCALHFRKHGLAFLAQK